MHEATLKAEPRQEIIGFRGRLGFWLPLVLFFALIVLPQLLFSSGGYRSDPRFVALLVCAGFAPVVFPAGRREFGKQGIIFAAALLTAHLAAWVGGMQNGAGFLRPALSAAAGIIAVSGLAVLIVRGLRAPWRKALKWTALLMLGMLLFTSYACYFLPIEKMIPLGGNARYFEPTRLALIWPTRLPMRWLGQIAWEHANHAGFIFAIGQIMSLEYLALKTEGRRWSWWLLIVLLGAAVFLTGSRTAWLMILAPLPFVVFKRRAGFVLPLIFALAGSVLLGLASLQVKEKLAHPVPTATPVRDIHVEGLVERGSAGRLSAYEVLWDDFSGSRTFGKGLGVTGKPVAHLLHEHSSYIATFRGGGFIALAAHGVVLLLSLWAAAVLFSKGVRWPLVFLMAVLPGLLFDRGNVFIMSGRYEFAFHWVAVLLPLILERKLSAGNGLPP